MPENKTIELRTLIQQMLANGKVEGNELEILRREVHDHGPIDRRKAELLVDMHKRVERRTPGFEHFFYQTIKTFLLRTDTVSTADLDWMQTTLFSEAKPSDQALKLLRELHGEAKSVSPEFQAFYDRTTK